MSVAAVTVERFHRLALSTSLRSGRRVGSRGEEVAGSLLLGWLDVAERGFWVTHQSALPESPHLKGRKSVRGVAPFAGGIAACNTSQLFLLDPELRRIERVFSERRLGDVHSIAARDGVLYLTATSADSILGVDESFRLVYEWWAGDDPALRPYVRPWQHRLMASGFDYRCFDRPDARFHINHVFFDEANGDLLINVPGVRSRRGIAWVWNVTRRERLLGGLPVPGAVRSMIHDGILLGEHLYLSRTGRGDFVKLDRATGELLAAVECRVPLGTTTGDPTAGDCGWLRGAVHLGQELFLVGQSKLTLLLVDMARGTRTGPLAVHGAEGEIHHPGLALYSIAKLPEEPPRARFSSAS